jgi:chorismate mutase
MGMFALRGATTVERNEADAIREATTALMEAILDRNGLRPEQVISCVFTATHDLDAEFPAAAARAVGFESVPLLCAQEIPVPGSLPRVVRVLLHYHADDGHTPEHVYLGEARSLRADLHAAQ